MGKDTSFLPERVQLISVDYIWKKYMEQSLGANVIKLFTMVIFIIFMIVALALPTNIRLGWKGLRGTNTLSSLTAKMWYVEY